MNKSTSNILRIGLALVFLANGLAAVFMPQEFMELLESSFVTQIIPLPISVFVVIIGVNDLLMSVLVFFNKYPKYIFAWAMVWLTGVMIVIGEPFDILEHLGFFSMALALWLNANYKNGNNR